MQAKILRLNTAGQPMEWLNWKQCVTLYAREIVSWSLGGVVRRVHGGESKITGHHSFIDVPAIVACNGERINPYQHCPPLSNPGLFSRDNSQCLYCGNYFLDRDLSRDHVVPSSRGGEDRWENVVAACLRCNQRKGQSLLEEINMKLIALPYCPNNYEYLALINTNRIRGDQMEYLRPKFSNYTGRLIGARGKSFHVQF